MCKILIATFLVAATTAWNGQEPIFPGPCRTFDDLGGGQENFNEQEYMGLWFEVERYENVGAASGDCVQAQYSFHLTLPGMELVNTMLVVAEGRWGADIARGVISFPNEVPIRGLYNVTAPDYNPNTPVSNYWILKTDYTNYAVVANCRELSDDTHREAFWFLSRTYPPTAASRHEADQIIDQYFRRDYIRRTTQGIAECFGPRP